MPTTTFPPILIWQPGGGTPIGPVSNPPVYSQAGILPLVIGQNYADVVFGSIQTTSDWVLVECDVTNMVDLTPLNIWPGLITNRTTTGFRVWLNGLPDTGNYYLHWAVSGINIVPSPANTYFLSGPSTGPYAPFLSLHSSNFTVHLPPSTTSGLVTVTPNDGGTGGAFSPASVVLSTASASATFTYVPAAYGTVTIGVTNSSSILSNPPSLTFTAVAATYTLTGPSTGGLVGPSSPFTVALPAGGIVLGTVTVTPNDSSGGGTFTPTSVGLTTGAPSATFTYTPSTAGVKTISTTNNGGLTDPVSLTYTATFAPTDIAGLKLWLKADALALSDGTAVATWPDSSGLGNDAAQATGSLRPLFKTNILNGKPILRFDGVDDYMSANMLGSLTTTASVFIVQLHRNIAAGAQALRSEPSVPSNSFGIYLPFSDANVYFDLGDSTGTGRVSGPWGGDTTHFFVWSFVAGGGNMAVYRNGTTVVSTGGHTNSFTPSGLTLDINGAAGPASNDADCAEILIYNTALSSTDRVNLENFLKTKYGL